MWDPAWRGEWSWGENEWSGDGGWEQPAGQLPAVGRSLLSQLQKTGPADDNDAGKRVNLKATQQVRSMLKGQGEKQPPAAVQIRSLLKGQSEKRSPPAAPAPAKPAAADPAPPPLPPPAHPPPAAPLRPTPTLIPPAHHSPMLWSMLWQQQMAAAMQMQRHAAPQVAVNVPSQTVNGAVVRRAPPAAPPHWEEAFAFACPNCELVDFSGSGSCARCDFFGRPDQKEEEEEEAGSSPRRDKPEPAEDDASSDQSRPERDEETVVLRSGKESPPVPQQRDSPRKQQGEISQLPQTRPSVESPTELSFQCSAVSDSDSDDEEVVIPPHLEDFYSYTHVH